MVRKVGLISSPREGHCSEGEEAECSRRQRAHKLRDTKLESISEGKASPRPVSIATELPLLLFFFFSPFFLFPPFHLYLSEQTQWSGVVSELRPVRKRQVTSLGSVVQNVLSVYSCHFSYKFDRDDSWGWIDCQVLYLCRVYSEMCHQVRKSEMNK